MSHGAASCELSVNDSRAAQIQEKEEDVRCFAHEAALKSAKVTTAVCDEAMGKMEKWLNLWIHEVVTHRKKQSEQQCCEAESQRNFRSCYPWSGKC